MLDMFSRVNITLEIGGYQDGKHTSGIEVITMPETSYRHSTYHLLIWDTGDGKRSFIKDLLEVHPHAVAPARTPYDAITNRSIRRASDYCEDPTMLHVLEEIFKLGTGWRLRHLMVRKDKDDITENGLFFYRVLYCCTEDGNYDLKITNYSLTNMYTLLFMIHTAMNMKPTRFAAAMLHKYANNSIYVREARRSFMV